jgi:hypothetical protein
MGDRLAAFGVALGAGGFGLTLAQLGQIATIFAGLTGGLASIAAFAYYIYKMKKGG